MRPFYQGKALRHGRYSAAGNVYMITAVTACRHPVFDDFLHGRSTIKAIRDSDRRGFSNTYAFVVMPDHLHWLFQLEAEETLSRVVQRVKSQTTREIRRQPGKVVQVWQAGFHDHAMRTDERLVDTARYILANPLRAGLCRSIREYPHWDCVWV